MAGPGAAPRHPLDAVRDHGFHPLRVARVVDETADASSFVLDVPDELRDAFAYEAGQFCTFRVWIDGEPHLRCYSMSSTPGVDDELQVTVKRVPGGARVELDASTRSRAGDEVEVTLPGRRLPARRPATATLVAFAGGQRHHPGASRCVKAALATTAPPGPPALRQPRPRRRRSSRAELDALADQHPDRLERRAPPRRRPRLRRRRRGRAVRLGGATDADVYVCGPDAVHGHRRGQRCSTQGVDAGRIHIERFTPAEPIVDADAEADAGDDGADDGDHRARRPHRDRRAPSRHHHPADGPPAGHVAAVLVRVGQLRDLHGAGWSRARSTMHVNNALTDDEVAEGWVLTCQSVPTSADGPGRLRVRGGLTMDQADIADIIELEQLLARYAVGMTKDDIDAVVEVFTPDGTYSAFGDTYPLADFPTLVAAAPKGLFLVGPAGARARRRRRARASSRCASSTRPTTTCASAGTPTPTGAPPDGLAAAHPVDDVPAQERRPRLRPGPRPDAAPTPTSVERVAVDGARRVPDVARRAGSTSTPTSSAPGLRGRGHARRADGAAVAR